MAAINRRRDHGRLYAHSDFGPPGQLKPTNQDYLLAWSAKHQITSNRPVCLAVALADGVSTTWGSESAARTACHAALKGLISADAAAVSPKQRALNSFNAAIQGIQSLFEEVCSKPQVHRPSKVFESTWRYVLRRKKLLNTTLTIGWLEDNKFYAAIIGDGGILLRSSNVAAGMAGDPPELLVSSADTNQVNALGPATRHITELDFWVERSLYTTSAIALYTDGIDRGFYGDHGSLVASLERSNICQDVNPCKEIIKTLVAEYPDRFFDNLSLIWITLSPSLCKR